MALQGFQLEKMRVFFNQNYTIPIYQREYSWDKSEWEDFWDDLKETKDNKSDVHFFGQIVVHADENDKKFYIIDGQQRTITSIIFLWAVRAVLKKYYDAISDPKVKEGTNYRINSIRTYCLGELDDPNCDSTLHLGSPNDDKYFNEVILNSDSNPIKKPKKKSHQRMFDAFNYFYERLIDEANQFQTADKSCECVKEYLFIFYDHFKVMYMETSKLEEAYIIFETLNARGKELETADLLKNFIFSKSNNAKVAENQWNEMISALTPSKNSKSVDATKFIRHYWNSNHSFTREKILYRKISRSVNTSQDSQELLNELCKYAPYYHDMTYPEEASTFRNEALVEELQHLDTLGGKTFYPLILSMIKDGFTENDIYNVLRIIELYIFRNFTIRKQVANSTEVFFSNIANEIANKKYSTADEICGVIKKGIISDQEFKAAFEVWSGKATGNIQYIFREINKVIDPNNEINLKGSSVHVEHIMPITADQWEISEEDHEEYLWRLGNLTLLSGKINREISNKPFKEKQKKYQSSKIELNKYFSKLKSWGPKEIEERQRKLANYAVKIWKV